MTKEELRTYLQAWMDSRLEAERLAAMAPSPAVDSAYARAKADEEYDRALYFRLRAQFNTEHGTTGFPMEDPS